MAEPNIFAVAPQKPSFITAMDFAKKKPIKIQSLALLISLSDPATPVRRNIGF